MKKITIFILLSISSNYFSQNYLGISSSNYAGSMGTDIQPASFVDGRFKFDLNLFSLNFSAYQNFAHFDTRGMDKWWVKSFSPDETVTINPDGSETTSYSTEIGGSNPYNDWIIPESDFDSLYITRRYDQNSPGVLGFNTNFQFDLLNFNFHVTPKISVGFLAKMRSITNIVNVAPKLAFLAERELEYEDFDYNIIKPNISPFADNLVNEIWPFLRMLWLTRGGYTAEIKFNPEIDLKEFGSQFGPGMFTGVYKFRINAGGSWTANFEYKFEQIDNPYDNRAPERKGAFFAQDYSRMQSNAAKRARALAKPTWDKLKGRDDIDFNDLLEEEKFLNENIDFSFEHKFIGTGKWNRKEAVIAVPDEIGKGVNNDNEHLASKASFTKAADAVSRINVKEID